MARKEFYNTKAWKKNSKLFCISRNCICERCGRPVYVAGITDYLPKEKRLKYVVHHKEYLNEINYSDESISMDWDNLELLCIDCHNNEHSRGGAIRSDLMFDEMGNVVEVRKIKREMSPPLADV